MDRVASPDRLSYPEESSAQPSVDTSTPFQIELPIPTQANPYQNHRNLGVQPSSELTAENNDETVSPPPGRGSETLTRTETLTPAPTINQLTTTGSLAGFVLEATTRAEQSTAVLIDRLVESQGLERDNPVTDTPQRVLQVPPIRTENTATTPPEQSNAHDVPEPVSPHKVLVAPPASHEQAPEESEDIQVPKIRPPSRVLSIPPAHTELPTTQEPDDDAIERPDLGEEEARPDMPNQQLEKSPSVHELPTMRSPELIVKGIDTNEAVLALREIRKRAIDNTVDTQEAIGLIEKLFTDADTERISAKLLATAVAELGRAGVELPDEMVDEMIELEKMGREGANGTFEYAQSLDTAGQRLHESTERLLKVGISDTGTQLFQYSGTDTAGAWRRTPEERGRILEDFSANVLKKEYGDRLIQLDYANVPKHPVIDYWIPDIGHIISHKSIDPRYPVYADHPKDFYHKLGKYTKELVNYTPEKINDTLVEPEDYQDKSLYLALPGDGLNKRQAEKIGKLVTRSQYSGIMFNIVIYP